MKKVPLFPSYNNMVEFYKTKSILLFLYFTWFYVYKIKEISTGHSMLAHVYWTFAVLDTVLGIFSNSDRMEIHFTRDSVQRPHLLLLVS